MHVTMNMLTLLQVGPLLEAQLGSARLLLLVAAGVGLTGAVHVAMSVALTAATGDRSYLVQHSLGFSGILFELIALDAQRAAALGSQTRPVFGFFAVPTALYPWAMLVAMSVLIPGISFLGHLSGLLVGVGFARSPLKRLVPGAAALGPFDARFAGRPTFVACTDATLSGGAEVGGGGGPSVLAGACGGARRGASAVAAAIGAAATAAARRSASQSEDGGDEGAAGDLEEGRGLLHL